MASHRTTHLAAVGLAVLAAAAPAAQARPDGAPATPVVPEQATPVVPEQAAVIPIVHDADGGAARPALPQQASVDAWHAALARRGAHAVPPSSSSSPKSDDGTDWGDVAIYGGAGTAVLALLASGVALTLHRRETARKAGTLVASR